jgi:chaperonin GroES
LQLRRMQHVAHAESAGELMQPWTHIRPYGNRILARLDKRVGYVEGTTLDLIVPERYRKQPQTATVIAVGRPLIDNDGTRDPMQLAVGQRVLIGKWDGDPIAAPEHDPGGEYYLINMDGLTLSSINVDMVYATLEDDGSDALTFESAQESEAAE